MSGFDFTSNVDLNNTAELPGRGERYNPHPIAERFTGTNRFGHSSDFTDLFGSKEDQEDYIAGLFFVACFLGAIYLVWFILIIVFRCMGPNRVGFMSGGAFRRVVDPEKLKQHVLDYNPPPVTGTSSSDDGVDNKNDYEEEHPLKYYHEGFGLGKRPSRVRLCFLLSGVIFITFSILAVTQGLINLQTTVDTVNHNAYVIDQLAIEADSILQAVKDIRGTAIQARDQLVEELKDGKFCPSDQAVSQTPTVANSLAQAEEAVPLLTQLNDFVAGDVDDMQGSAAEVQVSANSLQTETDDIDFTSWQGLVILIPFTLIPCVLLAGTILALFGVEFPFLSCFLNWVAFPIFFLLVIFACICSVAMVVGASANADFCLPGGRNEDNTVDTSILRIMEREGYTNTTFEYEVATFYISQCQQGSDPFQILRDYTPQLEEGDAALRSLLGQLLDGQALAQLELHCNREFKGLELLLENMIDLIEVVIDALQRSLDLASCDTIIPIYTSVFYEGTCSYSLSAVMWVFSGFLIAAFFGLLMITLRSSYKQTVYLTPEEDLNLGESIEPAPAPADVVVQEVKPQLVDPPRETVEDYGLNNTTSNGSGFDDAPGKKAVPY